MSQMKSTAPGEQIIETMIELARCSRQHRIIVAGSTAAHQMFELHRRGYNRVATSMTCGLPRAQYDVALVDWYLHSINALETTLDWLVHFLAPASVLVICIESCGTQGHRKLASILERFGFRVEVGTRCEHGLAVSARRLDANQQALAA